jgi:two-component system, OmpR family, sensor histidine kinase PhoQ
MKSLNTRILLSASLVLAIFIALTGVTLEHAFQDSARSARQERMLGELYLLMAAAEVDPQGHLTMPDTLAEPDFNMPGSGHYATITDAAGKVIWQSPSALGVQVPYERQLGIGRKTFMLRQSSKGPAYFIQSYGVRWVTGHSAHAFTFSVTEDLTAFNAQVGHYRNSLWTALGAMSLLLLVAQAILLRWGLRPLRKVARDLGAIEAGDKERLEGNYPREIERLTDNLNLLLVHERAQQKRYRNALSDLAHSLKTPLAIMRVTLEVTGSREELATTVEEEVAKMDQIVNYQLQRAAPMAPAKLSGTHPVRPVVERIVASLDKVYRDKGVQATVAVPDNASLRLDPGDLMEILGNLIENAYKYGRHQVHVGFTRQAATALISVEDDGPGISDGQAQHILERGVRADTSVPGHGLGLDIVKNIVEAYGGDIQVGKSDLGGAVFALTLPAR